MKKIMIAGFVEPDEKYENYVEVLNSLTSEDVKEFASTLLKKARYIECVMNPEK